jgi:hypothetical protein
MVFAASHRAARKPAAPSLGCRGPIRLFGFNPRASSTENSVTVTHQSQMAVANNAVSPGGISDQMS